jgi:hypothetical protein
MIIVSTAQNSAPKSNETLLHHKLKLVYCKKENIKSEAIMNINNKKFRIDVINEEKKILYEIQRASFGDRFSKKIQLLLDSTQYIVRIVLPIIYKQKTSRMRKGEQLSVSYRNLNSSMLHLFNQLVFFKVAYQERLEFDILLVNEHITKEFTGYRKKSHRRIYRTEVRDLVEIVEKYEIRTMEDFLNLLPQNLPEQFTNQDLAKLLSLKYKTRRDYQLPGRITYSLCQLGILKRVGKKRNALLFQIVDPNY